MAISFRYKRPALLLICIFSALQSFAQRDVSTYYYSMDLTNVVDDKLKVELAAPKINTDEINFYLPKIVPGTYELYDFGRFVSEFQAIDTDGKEMQTVKTDSNTWKIKNAKNLKKVRYVVEDTWDTSIKGKFVFEPGGSNIEASKNFMINTHCFFGYFEGMKFAPFNIQIKYPQNFYGSTSMERSKELLKPSNTDIFISPNYIRLVDTPIMYCVPDTGLITVGGAKVLISVYSPNKKVSGKFVAGKIKQLLDAQCKYLGGKLPVDQYSFLVYLTDRESGSGASGALEHSYSSLYFLPEMAPDNIVQTIRDVAAHEFFHIVTPLNIHAEEIGNFDFQNGNMSEHLWMYEGVTEYSAGHMQVKYGLMEVSDYFDKIREKLYGAEDFKDDLPMTVMSKECLGQYNSQYGNVYQKGALIGMCLDIKLRSLSDGKYGIQDLMNDLAKSYGKDKSFKDAELFGEITKLTYPEIGEFLKKHVSGKDPLPFKAIFEMVGIDYTAEQVGNAITFGGITIGYDPTTQNLVIVETNRMDAFGKALGYQEGDLMIKFNKKKLTPDNGKEVITDFVKNAKVGNTLKVEVLRKTPQGKLKKKKLKAKIQPVQVAQKFLLKPASNASEKQLKVRKAWIGPIVD